MIKWFLDIFKKAIEIDIDGRCTCSCAHILKCPLGRIGSQPRCTIFELFCAEAKIKKTKRLQNEPNILELPEDYK